MTEVASNGCREKNDKLFLTNGPDADVEYPLSVIYCGECSMPVEYCDYGPDVAACRKWLERTLPGVFEQICLGVGTSKGVTVSADVAQANDVGAQGSDDKKRQTRGGKSAAKSSKGAKSGGTGSQFVTVGIVMKGKRKMTVVSGLHALDIDLKVASKTFGQKFACGSSVTAEDEVSIQGDFKDELIDLIIEKWPQVEYSMIKDVGEIKR